MGTSDQQLYKGKISFINHQKQFATIEYLHHNKEKSVNFRMDLGTGKKSHQFRLGDGVSFQLKLSDRGDKMAAYNVRFTHNSSIDLLLQKAQIENRFSGYFKIADDKYFVKEIDTYILFPLRLSEWETPPVSTAVNIAIAFKLINLDKPNAVQAELFSHSYIPEYRKALQHFNNEMDIDAKVIKISAYGVYLELFGEKMKAKMSLAEAGDVKEGDIIKVQITYLTPYRVVVKKLPE